MKKYCIVENGLLEQHAGSKARRDVADTLIRLGWEACPVHPIKVRVNVSYPERIRMALVFWKDWRRVEKTLQRGDELLIQYPLPPAVWPRTGSKNSGSSGGAGG